MAAADSAGASARERSGACWERRRVSAIHDGGERETRDRESGESVADRGVERVEGSRAEERKSRRRRRRERVAREGVGGERCSAGAGERQAGLLTPLLINLVTISCVHVLVLLYVINKYNISIIDNSIMFAV